ncbi:unnamed protein product [Linum tenue]|uniref:Uncharacterized protein n=1 Tax=Linum tenue TaxID=586396 RepID=A0AAV0I4I4_9ROSI|nr:unnamed protein product [Linum tenue]
MTNYGTIPTSSAATGGGSSSSAPDLAHRLHRRHGRLAVPLLPPRRAAGGVRAADRRPGRADRALGAHGGSAAPHRCSVEHRGVASGRGGVGRGSRGGEEDGGFVPR